MGVRVGQDGVATRANGHSRIPDGPPGAEGEPEGAEPKDLQEAGGGVHTWGGAACSGVWKGTHTGGPGGSIAPLDLHVSVPVPLYIETVAQLTSLEGHELEAPS